MARLADPQHSSLVGFYVNARGDPILLERPASRPRSRGRARQAMKAEREARRNQPMSKAAWMTR